MTSTIVFRDARIAGLYDLFNPRMACDDFYLDRTTRRGGAVLDVGCGTGMLACRIAAAGIVVVGVDPAEGMLSVARSRSGAECVGWIHSKAEDPDVDRRFRTIYMTGHAFQALIDDETAVASLSAMAAHLEPDGMVLFETRNPLRRAWERWKPDRARARMTHASLGPIIETHDARYEGDTGSANPTRVSVRIHRRSPGRVLPSSVSRPGACGDTGTRSRARGRRLFGGLVGRSLFGRQEGDHFRGVGHAIHLPESINFAPHSDASMRRALVSGGRAEFPDTWSAGSPPHATIPLSLPHPAGAPYRTIRTCPRAAS